MRILRWLGILILLLLALFLLGAPALPRGSPIDRQLAGSVGGGGPAAPAHR